MQKIKKVKRHTPGEQLCWECRFCDDSTNPCPHFTGNGETIQPFWEEYFLNPVTGLVYDLDLKRHRYEDVTSYRIVKCKNFEKRTRGCRK